MKTTLDLPDDLFRAAKSTAAQQGQTLRQFVSDALQEKLSTSGARMPIKPPRWLKFFGAAKGMEASIREIDAAIEAEFETIEEEPVQ